LHLAHLSPFRTRCIRSGVGPDKTNGAVHVAGPRTMAEPIVRHIPSKAFDQEARHALRSRKLLFFHFDGEPLKDPHHTFVAPASSGVLGDAVFIVLFGPVDHPPPAIWAKLHATEGFSRQRIA